MKNILAAILIVISIAISVVVRMPQVQKLHDYPISTLEQEAKAMQLSIDAVSIAGVKDNTAQKAQYRKEKTYYQIEILRRSFALDWMAILVGLIGVGMLVLNFLPKSTATNTSFKVRVHEMMPSEVYVEEQEFYRRSQDAFKSKDEAMQWYETDPLRICSYCGSTSVRPSKGQKMDEIQLTTFYKKVPQGAKDLRIVLGSLWFVYPTTELECEKCHQKVLR